jgi:hypothetical protein
MTSLAIHAAASPIKSLRDVSPKSILALTLQLTGKAIFNMIDHDLPVFQRANRRPPYRLVGFVTRVTAHNPAAKTAGFYGIAQ